MDEIWYIVIGLSSLIASIVTVTMGIVRDFFIEKYRFKRQSEADYVQRQVRLFSQTYFFIKRFEMWAVKEEFFGKFEEEIKELNDLIKINADLLGPEILIEWLTIMSLFGKIMESKKEERKEIMEEIRHHMSHLYAVVKETFNTKLIPKYRNIVGETVKELD